MAEVSLWATLAIGFALGLKHALDTDHIVAVSTLVARERSVWRSTRIGLVWGLGHTATLLVIGFLMLATGWRISERWSQVLELCVALMLVALGARTLGAWRRGEGHMCVHRHGDHAHAHFHRHGEHACALEEAEATIEVEAKTEGESEGVMRRQSFLVGAVHGLSGSAALMLLVLSTIRHPVWALLYVAVFGLGMIVAMFALTTLFSCALNLTDKWEGQSWRYVDHAVRGLTGVASLGFGLYLTYQIGVVDGLFRMTGS